MTTRTRHGLTLALLTTLVALVGCLLFVKGSRAQEPDTTTLRWRHTDQVWQTTVYVAGIPIDVVPHDCGDEDPLTRCADVPGLVEPYSWDTLTCNADGCSWGVLLDGSPGPLVVYRSRACRLDVSANGVVDLGDVGGLLRSFGGVCP